ncbi:hypothetical protein A3K55_02355 [Candidatus Shapirobacteria bacterium RBG_13_44_7]|uniref:Uncharacterized protein n=1 Tax=Candidatus Shapirobacteria bacterium RBG_13_44_7 TaxID=1802149 RepID=A0A1F7SF03_9BACT|nr:MAG: hypothetical protein A3K55_02355 [Candidatus Shapirobacteria bacterium RBG_13_44_7]
MNNIGLWVLKLNGGDGEIGGILAILGYLGAFGLNRWAFLRINKLFRWGFLADLGKEAKKCVITNYKLGDIVRLE